MCTELSTSGKLETDVYRKPTHTDKYFSYDSHHPVSHKRSVAKTLLQRAESLPSNSDSQVIEREYVLNVLGENDYPKRFLNDFLRSPVCRNQNNSEDDTSEDDTSSIHSRCHRNNQENLK
jgi:hypothetical protein